MAMLARHTGMATHKGTILMTITQGKPKPTATVYKILYAWSEANHNDSPDILYSVVLADESDRLDVAIETYRKATQGLVHQGSSDPILSRYDWISSTDSHPNPDTEADFIDYSIHFTGLESKHITKLLRWFQNRDYYDRSHKRFAAQEAS